MSRQPLPFAVARRVPDGRYLGPAPTPTNRSPLRLDSNEGPAPAVWLAEALAQAGPQLLQRYPDATPLQRLLAEREGLPADQLLITAGGDEALERICRLVLEPGRSAVLPVPTFEMIERYIALAEGTLRPVPWTTGDYPVDQVLAAVDHTTAAIFVVSPNNPTGLCASPDAVRRLAVAAPHVLLVVDLAYTEFADVDLTALVHDLPNAVAVRTLSKAWGLAGLRIGWVAGPTAVIQRLRALGGPSSVAAPSLHLAERWLREGDGPTAAFVAAVRCHRQTVRQQLLDLGCTVEPSQGNFVLARLPMGSARPLQQRLTAAGVLVRNWPGRPELLDAVRITCPGDGESLALLQGALAQCLPISEPVAEERQP